MKIRSLIPFIIFEIGQNEEIDMKECLRLIKEEAGKEILKGQSLQATAKYFAKLAEECRR